MFLFAVFFVKKISGKGKKQIIDCGTPATVCMIQKELMRTAAVAVKVEDNNSDCGKCSRKIKTFFSFHFR